MHAIATLLLVLLCALCARGEESALTRADAAWARRAEGQQEGVARPEPIGAAIEAYQQAVAVEPESLEAHWKLLRAYWFDADFARADESETRRVHAQALAAAERAFAVLAERVGGRERFEDLSPEAFAESLAERDHRDAAALYLWYSINLGAWGQTVGAIQAVRSGTAGRVHTATLRSIALEPDVEQGGALRMLSRLHTEVPYIPFFSGWVDHEQSVTIAERALRDYPQHPANAYILGIALLSNSAERFDEGVVLIERTAQLEPRADYLVEDLSIRDDARKRLAVAAQAR